MTPHSALQGMSVQLHVPYSEHAKAPVGPASMGLPLTVDHKKLGRTWACPPGGRAEGVREGGSLGPWDSR